MKQTLITLSLTAILLCSCTPSREKAINRLIETEICNSLVNPRSYDPIDTRIDSAFTPLDDMKFYARINRFWDKCDEATEVKAGLDSIENALTLVKGYLGLLNPGNILGLEDMDGYKDLKTKCNDNLQAIKDNYNEIIAAAQQDLDTLNQALESPATFIGYHAQHRYRSENAEGKLQLDTLHLFITPDLDQITATMKDHDWQHLQHLYQELLATRQQ